MLFRSKGWAGHADSVQADPGWQSDLCSLMGPSLTLLADGVAQAEPFFTTPALNEAAEGQLASDGAKPALQALLQLLPPGPLDSAQAQELLGQAAQEAGVKKGVIMKSLRAALLGSLQGPDLLATWLLLHRSGDDRARIERCL